MPYYPGLINPSGGRGSRDSYLKNVYPRCKDKVNLTIGFNNGGNLCKMVEKQGCKTNILT